jgi:hypothetical protein
MADRSLLNSGALHFADLPQSVLWHDLAAHVGKLAGASGLEVLTDEVTEGFIDFDWRGHHFTINDQSGDYWFVVDDPTCPEEILQALLQHCQRLLGPPRTVLRVVPLEQLYRKWERFYKHPLPRRASR